MLPNRLIVRAYARRGARLWFVTRALGSLAVVLAGADPLHVAGALAINVNFVVLSAAVAFLDSWVRRERALLGNLGISTPALTALFIAPALVGESVLHVAVVILS